MEPTAVSDDELLACFVRAGDRAALDALLRRHLDAAFRVARRFLHADSDAEDAVQTAFIQVVTKARQYRPRVTVKSWMLAIVANAALQRIRSEMRRRKHESEATVEPPSVDGDAHAAVREAVDELPDHERMPIYLRFMENCSFAEVATILRIPETTARVQVHRGMERLRERLQGFGRPVGAAIIASALTASAAESATPILVASVEKIAYTAKAGGGVIGAGMAGLSAIGKGKLIAGALALLAVGGGAASAWAKGHHRAELIVAIGGDDANPGTRAAPFATIQRAVDAANGGDTVLVRAGRYRESVVFRRSGSAGKPITLANYPGEQPVIDAGAESPANAVIFQAETGYRNPIGWIAIRGFEIVNGFMCMKLYNAHDVVIQGNVLRGGVGSGIQGNGVRIAIVGNRIENNGGGGINLSGSDISIANNLIARNRSAGIGLSGYPLGEEGNYFNGDFCGARGWVVAHNTVAYNQKSAVSIWQEGAVDAVIEYNIFLDNVTDPSELGQAISFYYCGGGHLIRNNLFHSSSDHQPISIVGEQCGYRESGTATADPLLVDPQSGDFHLTAGSPAIDAAGIADRSVSDFSGTKRPLGMAGDLGAYEFALSR